MKQFENNTNSRGKVSTCAPKKRGCVCCDVIPDPREQKSSLCSIMFNYYDLYPSTDPPMSHMRDPMSPLLHTVENTLYKNTKTFSGREGMRNES
jgi:hypothetical protein